MAVGTMVLLMVVTVGFAPLVLPLAVEGVQVDAGQIAGSLVVFMLVPLGVALAVRARYPHVAGMLVGPIGRGC
jgi:BASS family bile acid:Na+ symporter